MAGVRSGIINWPGVMILPANIKSSLTKTEEGVEKREPSYTVGGNAN